MKKIMLILSLLTLTSISANAQFRDRQNPPPLENRERVRELEYRVRNLEDIIRNMDQRLRVIETGAIAPIPPHPVPASSYTCMLVDAGYTKTFYAKGSSRLQAETSVRQECGKSVHPSYCQSAVRCSDGNADPYARGYFCTLTDAGYSKIFTGEGADLIEAEAKAKQSCQSTVHASYCGNVSVRCEAIR